MGEIIIVGLGPGDPGLITQQTMSIIQDARPLFLRTVKHPSVPEILNGKEEYISYDYVYEEKATFDEVYQTIARDLIRRALEGAKIVYAVPGSPMVAEKTVELVRQYARDNNIKTVIYPGMSFLELMYSRLEIDPVNGVTIIDANDIQAAKVDVGTSLIITQVYNRQTASEIKLALMDIYPDDYPVAVARHLGLPDEEILRLPLYELDRIKNIDHLTSVYLAAHKDKQQTVFDMAPVIDVMATLRSPGGCLWDIEQTHSSLRRYIVEEVYEVLEAIDLKDSSKLCEELGDLLLQIVFHARVAEESGLFNMQDVIDTVTEKLIRRHPHVFGSITVQDAAEVVLNWENIKKRERNNKSRKSILDGIPKDLPSLMAAYKLQAKAAKVGFDWQSVEPVWAKVEEELAELREAAGSGDVEDIENELGDVLFAAVNLARFLGVEPEVALNQVNNKFRRRFGYIERQVSERGMKWEQLDLNQLDKLWDEAKRLEKQKKQ